MRVEHEGAAEHVSSSAILQENAPLKYGFQPLDKVAYEFGAAVVQLPSHDTSPALTSVFPG